MSDDRHNLLILGGTAEALQIAERLAARSDVHVVTSIAGREEGASAPAEGDVRIGGFAGADALADFLAERRISLLIDASDPFQPTLREHAAKVAASSGVMRVVFDRPSCAEHDDDTWVRVRHAAEAADLAIGFGTRVLLDLPSAELDAFARLQSLWFLLRGGERPGETVPLASFERVAWRSGATVEQEEALLKQHAVNLIVTRNSGSEPVNRLLLAARSLHVPVLLLDRPPLPPSDVVEDIDALVAWVEERLLELNGHPRVPRSA